MTAHSKYGKCGVKPKKLVPLSSRKDRKKLSKIKVEGEVNVHGIHDLRRARMKERHGKSIEQG